MKQEASQEGSGVELPVKFAERVKRKRGVFEIN
jgi:hypothetical protein